MTAKTWLLASACALMLVLTSFAAQRRHGPPRFEVTGHIGGLDGSRVVVRLMSHNRPDHSISTRRDGSFLFRAVVPGRYTVRPVDPRFHFSPASRTVIVTRHDIGGIDFHARELPRPRRRR
jgi:hypothetical protein